jgi:cytochrome P450
MSAESPSTGAEAPVPLDPLALFDPAVAASPQETYRKFRDQCPVARTDSLLGSMTVLSRYDDVGTALRRTETFSSSAAIDIGQERPLIPLQIDPPEHAKYRRVLNPLFSPKRIALMEPAMRDLARRLIGEFVDKGACDFHTDFAVPLPCTVFLQVMGMPLGDVDLFLRWKDAIIRPPADLSDPTVAQKARAAAATEIYAYFDAMITEREKDPRDDLLTEFTTEEVDGEKLTREAILDTCFLFLLAGLDTVTATLDCFIARLADRPEERAHIASGPDAASAAVEELLRWETPVMAIPRLVTSDVTLHDQLLSAGDVVIMMIGAANTDERQWATADSVDFARGRNPHFAFGAGPHRCLGSHLARSELRIALEEFHRAVPDYAIAPGTTLAFTTGIRQVDTLPLVFPSP